MAAKKIEPLSLYRNLKRSYNRQEFIEEVSNLLNSDNDYVDFVLVANGPEISSTRFGSTEPKDLRMGDILFMLEKAKHELFGILNEEEE